MRSDHKGCVVNCKSIGEYGFTNSVYKCARACGIEETGTVIAVSGDVCIASCPTDNT